MVVKQLCRNQNHPVSEMESLQLKRVALFGF